jgi:hypothetical protein
MKTEGKRDGRSRLAAIKFMASTSEVEWSTQNGKRARVAMPHRRFSLSPQFTKRQNMPGRQ